MSNNPMPATFWLRADNRVVVDEDEDLTTMHVTASVKADDHDDRGAHGRIQRLIKHLVDEGFTVFNLSYEHGMERACNGTTIKWDGRYLHWIAYPSDARDACFEIARGGFATVKVIPSWDELVTEINAALKASEYADVEWDEHRNRLEAMLVETSIAISDALDRGALA